MTTVLHAERGRFPFCSAIVRSEPAAGARTRTDAARPKSLGKRDMTSGIAEGRTQGTGTASQLPRGRTSRRRLVSRIWQTAERQVAEIESRLAGLRDDPQALERDAKILAIVTRTVRDIVALDQEAGGLTQRARTDEARAEPDAKPLAEFRDELARQLDQLRRERAGESAD